MKLSIIIPYYNTANLLIELLDKLNKQMKPDIEVIVVDDCSDIPIVVDYEWLKVIRLDKNSGVAGKPRNIGLDNAKGEYIAFIDSDDMVADDYIQKILYKIQSKPDIIFLSWKMPQQTFIITSKPLKWNCAVWCRVYKREIIGETRFDESLKIAEDWKFNQAIKYNTSTCIREPIYLYNSGREGSLTNG